MPADAVFVSNELSLGDRPGGQQLCTREYLATVRAAGYEPETVSFRMQYDFAARLRRKLFGAGAYQFGLPADLADRIVAAAERTNARAVFLNLVETAALAPELRRRLPASAQLAFLSHGLESADEVHALRLEARLSARQRRRLGDQLLLEAKTRPSFDHVFTLAPFEAEVERWLGARRVTWLPRQMLLDALPWKPVEGRIGFVGTMDHPPTREALDLFLPALAERLKPGVRLRLVGGPDHLGKARAAAYPFIDYLGYIGDAELAAEAATWTSYPQPIFCYARGASTKLATALGWRIPVVTTPAGARGYQWRSGGPIVVETAAEVAECTVRIALDAAARNAARADVVLAADTAPTLAEVAAKLRHALETGRGQQLDGACR